MLNSLMDNFNSYIVRNSFKKNIIYFLIPSIALTAICYDIDNLQKWYNKNSVGCIGLISFLTLLLIYFGYKTFDRRIKIRINNSGLWTLKYGLTEWKEIEAFHFQIKENSKTREVILWIELLEIGNSLKLEISRLETDEVDLTENIKRFSAKYRVRNSGIDTY